MPFILLRFEIWLLNLLNTETWSRHFKPLSPDLRSFTIRRYFDFDDDSSILGIRPSAERARSQQGRDRKGRWYGLKEVLDALTKRFQPESPELKPSLQRIIIELRIPARDKLVTGDGSELQSYLFEPLNKVMLDLEFQNMTIDGFMPEPIYAYEDSRQSNDNRIINAMKVRGVIETYKIPVTFKGLLCNPPETHTQGINAGCAQNYSTDQKIMHSSPSYKTTMKGRPMFPRGTSTILISLTP